MERSRVSPFPGGFPTRVAMVDSMVFRLNQGKDPPILSAPFPVSCLRIKRINELGFLTAKFRSD